MFKTLHGLSLYTVINNMVVLCNKKKGINTCSFNLINLQFTTQHICSCSIYEISLKSFFSEIKKIKLNI